MISALPLETALLEHLKNDDLPALQAFLATQAAPDLADVLDRLKDDQRLMIFTQLPPAQAAEVLAEAGSETTRTLLAHLSPAQAGMLLDALPMDDVAHIITDNVPERAEQLLAHMTPADAQEVRTLLQYPKHSAGRLMTEKFVRIPPTLTADQVLAQLRRIDRDAETFTDLYVVNEQRQLLGVVSLRQLILAPPSKPWVSL